MLRGLRELQIFKFGATSDADLHLIWKPREKKEGSLKEGEVSRRGGGVLSENLAGWFSQNMRLELFVCFGALFTVLPSIFYSVVCTSLLSVASGLEGTRKVSLKRILFPLFRISLYCIVLCCSVLRTIIKDRRGFCPPPKKSSSCIFLSLPNWIFCKLQK